MAALIRLQINELFRKLLLRNYSLCFNTSTEMLSNPTSFVQLLHFLFFSPLYSNMSSFLCFDDGAGVKYLIRLIRSMSVSPGHKAFKHQNQSVSFTVWIKIIVIFKQTDCFYHLINVRLAPFLTQSLQQDSK